MVCDRHCRSLRDQVVGYYIAEVIIYGNPLAPVSSIPGNLVQIGVAAVIVLIVITPLNLAARKTGLKKQLITAAVIYGNTIKIKR